MILDIIGLEVDLKGETGQIRLGDGPERRDWTDYARIWTRKVRLDRVGYEVDQKDKTGQCRSGGGIER